MSKPSLKLRDVHCPAATGRSLNCDAQYDDSFSPSRVQVVVFVVDARKWNSIVEVSVASRGNACRIAAEESRKTQGQNLARMFFPAAKLMSSGLPEPEV